MVRGRYASLVDARREERVEPPQEQGYRFRETSDDGEFRDWTYISLATLLETVR